MGQAEILDTAKAEAFGERMLNAVNEASLVLMTSVGHRTGLFDAMAGIEPATSDEIAAAAGLDERYVREWLGAMVTARVVEYEPERETYRLPAEHGAALTRAAGPDNLGPFAGYIPILAAVEDEVVECFRNGGGVPYSSYPRLQEALRDDSGAVADATLLDVVLPLADGLVDRLHEGIDAADIGCGHGHALNLMARAFPNSRFTGYDISERGIEMARREAAETGLENVRFELLDLVELDRRDGFDLITAFDVIHDQAQPAEVLARVAAALRAGGTFLMVDVAASSRLEENLDHPIGPTIYTLSTLHCMTVSLAAGGAGLGTAWGEQRALEMLADAGFDRVDVKRVEGDFFNNYYVARAGSA
ncbi:MAG TPA: methyltransferase domain-containing protein [Solirubrobacterales bacterium]|nr:methyltransferase domain-containing protein [Solirubrobacterales bacterium]